MADIDKLEAIARAATPGLWSFERHTTGLNGCHSASDDWTVYGPDRQSLCFEGGLPSLGDPEHIATFAPDRVLALLAVVRAAKRIDEALAPVSFERGQFADLRTALAALDALDALEDGE